MLKMLCIYNKFLEFAKETGVEMVDFRFTDILGLCHHMTIPLAALSAEGMKEGIGFDSSSIKGWSPVHKSDMLMVPDINLELTNVYRDPFSSCPTLIVFCKIIDVTHQDIYERDPRSLAKRAEKYLTSLPFVNQAYFGPELEFFIFDSVTFNNQSNACSYEVDGHEMMHHNMDKNNLGYRPSHKGGYVPVSPIDGGHEIRTEICKVLQETGIHVERHHHEVAPCQHEIGIRFNTLTLMGDQIQLYKYIVKNVAYRYGKTATFMPKPMFEENGSGMHVHQSLWLDDENLFAGNNYAGLSEMALYYVGGILAHAKSLNAFTNPTTNSYKRLVPGYEAPIMCAYSHQNRSSACRIPFVNNEKARRIEIRFPDPAANGYLALSAMLMAGLDGIEKKIHPGDHTSLNLYEQKTDHQEMCGSLGEAICALKKDHDYLLKGDVFSKDFIENYIALKKEEIMHYERRPHPIEFSMYYCL